MTTEQHNRPPEPAAGASARIERFLAGALRTSSWSTARAAVQRIALPSFSGQLMRRYQAPSQLAALSRSIAQRFQLAQSASADGDLPLAAGPAPASLAQPTSYPGYPSYLGLRAAPASQGVSRSTAAGQDTALAGALSSHGWQIEAQPISVPPTSALTPAPDAVADRDIGSGGSPGMVQAASALNPPALEATHAVALLPEPANMPTLDQPAAGSAEPTPIERSADRSADSSADAQRVVESLPQTRRQAPMPALEPAALPLVVGRMIAPAIRLGGDPLARMGYSGQSQSPLLRRSIAARSSRLASATAAIEHPAAATPPATTPNLPLRANSSMPSLADRQSDPSIAATAMPSSASAQPEPQADSAGAATQTPARLDHADQATTSTSLELPPIDRAPHTHDRPSLAEHQLLVRFAEQLIARYIERPAQVPQQSIGSQPIAPAPVMRTFLPTVDSAHASASHTLPELLPLKAAQATEPATVAPEQVRLPIDSMLPSQQNPLSWLPVGDAAMNDSARGAADSSPSPISAPLQPMQNMVGANQLMQRAATPLPQSSWNMPPLAQRVLNRVVQSGPNARAVANSGDRPLIARAAVAQAPATMQLGARDLGASEPPSIHATNAPETGLNAAGSSSIEPSIESAGSAQPSAWMYGSLSGPVEHSSAGAPATPTFGEPPAPELVWPTAIHRSAATAPQPSAGEMSVPTTPLILANRVIERSVAADHNPGIAQSSAALLHGAAPAVQRAPDPPLADAAGAAGPSGNIEEIARKVFEYLRRELAIERERIGWRAWP